MLDFSNKELVRSFVVSDFRQDRRMSKRENYLGRTMIVYGVACATTMVTDCWKVYDPSVKLYKYVYLGGVARQHPADLNIRYSDGVEIAHEHAMTKPVFKLEFNKPISYELIEDLMWGYIAGLPVSMLKTKKELEIEKFFIDNEREG